MNNTSNYTLNQLLEQFEVEIPKVQRDYAQGREDLQTNEIRKELLDDIKKSITKQSPTLQLNFIYGKTAGTKFIPVDGQQRLTTLFLLHVYAYRNDKSKTDLLNKFTYETRESSRNFFEKLVANRETIFNSQNAPSVYIKDATWFSYGWEYDPTVQSALVMLDDISKKFSEIVDLAECLENTQDKFVSFEFLEIEQLGDPDSLYIKMNARGKPLTHFEIFKAKLIGRLKKLKFNSQDFIYDFEVLLDGQWTDLFWAKYEETHDRYFLEFFRRYLLDNYLVTNRPNSYKDWSQYWYLDYDYEKLNESVFESIYNILNHLSSKQTFRNLDHAKKLIFSVLELGTNDNDLALGNQKRPLFYLATSCLSQSDVSDDDAFFQWLRIGKNLINNTTIDRFETYIRIVFDLNQLEERRSNLLQFFSSKKIEYLYFDKEQIREEHIKAQLIMQSESEDGSFAKAIYRAEELPYFSGQIRAALYKSKTLENGSFDPKVFSREWEKLEALFGDYQTSDNDSSTLHCGKLIRQALLSFGDYKKLVREDSQYFTLYIDNPNSSYRTHNLKWLFSSSLDEDGRFEQAKEVQLLLEQIQSNLDIERQLRSIIKSSSVLKNEWRYCFIEFIALFDRLSHNEMRIFEQKGDMLLIRGLWGHVALNRDVFLEALRLALAKHRVKMKQTRKTGFDGHYRLEFESAESVLPKGEYIYITFHDKVFTFWKANHEVDIEIKLEEGLDGVEKIKQTTSDDPISEAVNELTHLI